MPALNVSAAAARSYAKALIDIGHESGELGRIYDELTALRKLYDEDRTFRAFFTSPRIDPDRKYAAVKAALGDKVGRTVLGLLRVMIRKRRELLLDNIHDQFERFRDLAEGRVHVHVQSARPLAAEQREAIAERVAARTGRMVQLHEQVEPKLLGGTVVRVGDVVIDGSLRKRIDALRRRLVAKERIF